MELEEWDDTTDVIMWIIEQKYADFFASTLEIGTSPFDLGRITNLDHQTAILKGWKEHKQVELFFEAEYAEVEEEDIAGIVFEDGFKVSVESYPYRKQKIAEYLVEGTERKHFKIIKEVKP